MSQQSNIEWTEATWNCLSGCRRISRGCGDSIGGGCYAEKMTKRLEAMGIEKYQGLLNEHGRFNGNVRFDRDALMIPLKRKKPTTYFVNSMSDWCHENVSDDWRDQMLAVMALTPQHTYQCLTKRAERMLEYLSNETTYEKVLWEAESILLSHFGDEDRFWTEDEGHISHAQPWPLPNVWLGVSVEDQKTADERIPLLLDTPAAIRFLSGEPLLEYVRIKNEWLEKLDWIIVGGESGANARLFNIEWARQLIRDCKAANVPVFVKQLGSHVLSGDGEFFDGDDEWAWPQGTVIEHRGEGVRVRLKDKKGGDMSEWPLDLRVREMPTKGEVNIKNG